MSRILKKAMFEYVKHVSQFSIIARKSNKKIKHGRRYAERFIARLF